MQSSFTGERALQRKASAVMAGRLDSQTRFHRTSRTALSYCNDGFGLLSDIVRQSFRLYGSFAEYLDKKILKPIGMDRSNISFIRNSQDEECSNPCILWRTEPGG